jgi:primosomal protein N' (replication factor Y)
MPEFLIVDLTAESKKRKLQAHFSEKLIEILTENLYNKKQAILFQNRRGYAPIIECPNCDWSMECPNCDVHLTFHKFSKTMRCHYCGYSTKLPEECPACGHPSLEVKGIGTERIEDEISNYLPDAKISRLDMDVARKKDGIQKILTDFEDQKIDILVGTQMITKGLDFDHIGVVGIINFDQLYRFPDFRCQERAFQLVTQVAGRAGRKKRSR